MARLLSLREQELQIKIARAAIADSLGQDKPAEVQHDLGFTHCHTCGFEIFDCECPEQVDLEDLLQ
jgi:uncharacterized protein (UPF0212 family)